ncbi:uncharacterized protein NECHADRAFT_80729 [Fusarium vanettenii 77-13-4]|uniref:Aminoglycoside phosphotransferase domain-containing protein n=1 Tax=Fusarium vanettenii (strain ATCC MYA-4622 / CBS 123669 / FGSC 9596 / NRRL 45880 / 77-13-4) TaxID=660122 RepID=C7YSG6_FUSV7|nr:uncharacterized protein NECHADRAFT_80729 [Fusarium vanettenii 77-13-4]EEU45633.1 predicted protein [Fusarium vanettenii 77-13-4]
MLTMERHLERLFMDLIEPKPMSGNFKWHFDFGLKRWDSSFRQINASSWLIFNKAILTQLPLEETKEEPNDYVDRKEGFIYRIRELGDDEARPNTTTSIPDQGPVRPRRAVYPGLYFEYLIGSAGSLKFMPAKADAEHVNHHAREHENIEYAAQQGPKHFRIPRVIYHAEFEYKYAILTERVGTSVFDEPMPAKFLKRLLGQIAKAVGEMAKWEAPLVQGVKGKDIQWWMFEHVISTIYSNGHRASDRVQEYLAGKGFNMSPCGFLNGHIGLGDVGLDQDFNLVGFNTWMDCAFVPKGYIASYVLDRIDYVSRPGDPQWELPTLLEASQRQGYASLFLNLVSQGLPNEIECFDKVLNDEHAIRARHLERRQRKLPWTKGFMFPENDPDFRPETFPN